MDDLDLSRPANAGANILMVDDDPGIRDVVSEFLTRHGYTVETAADAAGMERALERGDVDLMVLDIMLPGEDGLSICRRLAGSGGPPIIMLSAMGEDTDRIVGLEIGADDYLPKPCNPRELLARQHDVQHHQVDVAPLQRALHGGCVGGGLDGVAVPGQELRHHVTDARVVVDHQDVGAGARRAAQVEVIHAPGCSKPASPVNFDFATQFGAKFQPGNVPCRACPRTVQSRARTRSATKALEARSAPKVEVGPWPGTNCTSGPSGHNFWVMAAIRAS